MSITASMVKELRERTGAGMMECKKALTETNGDMEQAIAELRKRGEAKAAKKAGRIAAEGVIELAVADDATGAFMAEINSETDFVARDENFSGFAAELAAAGLANKAQDAAAMLAVETNGSTFEKKRQELITKIGENVNVRRCITLESTGVVGAYKHGTRIGVLVALEGGDQTLAKDIAMHIAATNPLAIDSSEMPQDVLAKERDIFVAQAKESGKPDNIIEKMVEGRLKKFLKENCLVDQPFVKNPDQTIAALLKEKGATVTAFTRYEVGEGIEKETVDFAEEVKAQVQGS